MSCDAVIAIPTVSLRPLAELEAVIERGLQAAVEAGCALSEIRERKLYQDQYATFEEYCRQRWAISRPRAYQLIGAADTAGHLSTIGVFAEKGVVRVKDF